MLLGRGEVLSGRLVVYDAMAMAIRKWLLAKKQDLAAHVACSERRRTRA